MIRPLLILVALIFASGPALAGSLQRVEVSAGRIVDLGIVHSRFTDPRRVVVWLPDSYRRGGLRHAVLYMHDGQNLFDKKTAGYGMEWQMDEELSRLIASKKVKPTIVVGIWNTPKRLQEYVPSKAFAYLPSDYISRVRGLYGGDPLSDGYLKFLVRELKPAIDRRFHVHTGRSDTAIMGSSMGALISLYAVDEYPAVFGSAGMLSTHWPLFLPTKGQKKISDPDFAAVSGAFEQYLRSALPLPATHKLYFDHGSETLDANYARYQDKVDVIVDRRGYIRDCNWMSLNFPGQAHNEISWASRVKIPLEFLLASTRGMIGRLC